MQVASSNPRALIARSRGTASDVGARSGRIRRLPGLRAAAAASVIAWSLLGAGTALALTGSGLQSTAATGTRPAADASAAATPPSPTIATMPAPQEGAPASPAPDPQNASATTDARATTPDDGASPSTGDIIVTANRTRENASRVPISIVAFSSEALTQSNIKSVADLGRVAPGVQFDQSAGIDSGTGTNISIRGISSTIGTSTTGIYFDEAPIQTRVASLSYFGNPLPTLFDLERVEVLRGPQGTLFGAGAEGGAVRFIAREPSLTEFSGLARAEISATQSGAPSYEGGVAIGGPLITDKLAFRASAWDRRDGGFVDRVDPFTGARVERNANWSNTFGGRLALLFKPVDAIRITPAFYAQISHLNDVNAFYQDLGDPANGDSRNAKLSRQPNTDRFYLPSLRIEGDLPGDLTFTSVSSYLIRQGRATPDTTGINGILFGGYGFGVPVGGNPADYPQFWAIPTDRSQVSNQFVSTNVRTFNQEVRLSNGAGNRFKWTVGAFYSHAVQTDRQRIVAPYFVETLINPVFGAGIRPTDPLLNSTIRSTDEQIAAFGQGDYKVTDKLVLTIGGRISHAVAGYRQDQSGFLSSTGNQTVSQQQGELKQHPWSGKIGLQYQIDAGNMVYASASRGYRIGGANQAIPSGPSDQGGCGVSAPSTYGSDKVNSFEAGTKGRLANGRLRFEADAFYVQWKNIQQNLFLPCQFGYITNAGDARTVGFDLSLRYALDDALTVNLATTFADARFNKNVLLPGAVAGTQGSVLVSDQDKVGGQGSAPWNITGGFDYTFAAFDHTVLWHVEDNFRSHDPGRLPTMNPLANNYSPLIPFNPSVNQLNTRITVTMGNVDVAAYVNNITNVHPYLYRYQDSPQSVQFYGITVRPRTVGLSLDLHY